MMKKLLYIPLFLLFLFCVGCTQNNGEIGNLFGFWRVTGEGISTNSGEEIIWAFQNDILEITVNKPHHDASKTYGTYTDTDDALRIDFTHWKGLTDKEYLYHMPAQLGLPENEPFVMRVAKREGNEMTLTYEGRTFNLKKIY